MTAKSHIILSSLPLIIGVKLNINYFISHPVFTATAFSGVILGAILPDIDEPKSFIGRKLPFLSYPLRWLGLKHRTFTHSLFFVVLITLLGKFYYFFYFVAFGAFMHIAEDMITNSGVYLFYPLIKKKIGFRLFDTGSVSETLFLSLMMILAGII